MKSNTWVMLRGLSREKGHWGPFADQFTQAFGGPEHVLQIDLPGTGEFRDTTSPATISEIFRFVRGQAVERAKTQTSFNLFAISLGGMVAMEWMKQRPDDLSGVVLVNTSLRSLSPVYHRLRWQIWGKFLKLLTIQQPRERERAIIDLLINSEEARARALPVWAKVATDHPVTYRSVLNQLQAAAFFSGLDRQVETPVLVLNGLGDRFVDPSCSTQLHEKWGWPLERHPWGGHDLPWDDAGWVIEKVRAWNSSTVAGRD